MSGKERRTMNDKISTEELAGKLNNICEEYDVEVKKDGTKAQKLLIICIGVLVLLSIIAISFGDVRIL